MSNPLYLRCISKYLDGVSDEKGLEQIEGCLSEIHFKKGDIPIHQSHLHAYAYIIVTGAARSYYFKEDKEINTWFAFENDTVATLQNYRGQTSRETIAFLEDSHCIKLDLPMLRLQAKTNVVASNLVTAILEEHIEFLEARLMLLQHNEGVERYLHILEHEPALIQRIPLTHLASYLGISRETLSRLRAKISL